MFRRKWVDTYQKESVRIPRVQEEGPACPVVCPLAAGKDFAEEESDDDADEFVAAVSDEIEELRVVVDGEEVHGDLQDDDFEEDDSEGGGGGGA